MCYCLGLAIVKQALERQSGEAIVSSSSLGCEILNGVVARVPSRRKRVEVHKGRGPS